MKALNKGNILGVRKYQVGGSAPISQMASRPVQQIEMPSRNQSLISPSGGVPKQPSLDDLTTSQLWEQVTGTPWSEASRRGHTDGYRESNMNLRQILTGADPIGTLDYIEKESNKAVTDEAPVKTIQQQPKVSVEQPAPRIIAKPGDQSFVRKTTPEPFPSQATPTQEVGNTTPADTTTLPDRNPSAHLTLGPATGGGFNWAGAGLIGAGGLAIGAAAFKSPVAKMISTRIQKLKAAKATKTAPVTTETPATVAETSAPETTETTPAVAPKETVVTPAETATAPATTPTEVVKPATTLTKTTTPTPKPASTPKPKVTKLAPKSGTTTEVPGTAPREAPAYFENNNTSAPTSFQQTAESIGKPQATISPKATVETSIKNRNRTTKPKVAEEQPVTTPKEAPANIKGKNSSKTTSFQETAQEVVKPQETTAPETAVQTSIKNRTAKAPVKDTQPSLFDEVGKVAETAAEGVGKVAETAKAVGKSGALKGLGKVAGRANMVGMVLDPALQVVRAWKYHFSSKDDYDRTYGAGSYDADHAATKKAEDDLKAGIHYDQYNPSATDQMMNRVMPYVKNGGKLNSVSSKRLLLRK